MSDLQKSFARQKFDNLPIDPPLPPNANMLEQEDRDSSSASSISSTGTIRPGPGQGLARKRPDAK